MIGKLIALVAFVAATASASCGLYTARNLDCNRCETGFLNYGPSFPVASCVPSCSPIAIPSCVFEPIRTVSAPVPAPAPSCVYQPVKTFTAPVPAPSCVLEPFKTVSNPIPAPVAAPVVTRVSEPVVTSCSPPLVARVAAPVVTRVAAPVTTEVGCGNVRYISGCGSRVLNTVY